MKLTHRHSMLALACAAGLGVAAQAPALTVTRDLPTLWIPNGTTGTGATLSIYDLPTGGRQFFFAYFANNDAGEDSWVVANTNTATGQNVFTDVPLIQNIGGEFNPSTSIAGTVVGSADFNFRSCTSMTVDYALGGGGVGTIEYTALIPNPECVWEAEFGASSCPAFATGTDADIPGSCILPPTLAQDVTLTNDHHWVISTDGFRFGNDMGPTGAVGNTLTIEPGTVIIGDTLPAGSLDLGAFFSISRGNRIHAAGNAESPIVFTARSHLLDGELGSGQWGGVLIAGRAPDNSCSPDACLDEIEINNYSGTDDEDSSGILRYVRIEYAGTEISALSELNGLSLFGVGSGTVIDHIHVHRNGDDGIEWFGGAANVKYGLVTDVDDDGFDWTSGAQHKVQYGVVRQTEAALKDSRGFEGDGLEGNESAEPRSMPQFANVTIYYEAGIGEGPQQALRLRRGTLGNFTNLLVTSAAGDLAPADCLRIDGPQSNIDAGTPDALTGAFTMTNTVLACTGGDLFHDNESELLESEFFNAQPGNTTAAPDLVRQMDGAQIGASNVNLIPAANSPAANVGLPPADVFDDFFDKVPYAGAFNPADEDDWTGGEWSNVDPDDSL